MRPALLARWLLADVRRRWSQVLVIAAVLGLGTGLYAAFVSLASWRVASMDASYALLRAHDLRVALPGGATLPEGTLAGVVRPVAGVEIARERLVVPTQIDASAPGRTVLTPGLLVGADTAPAPVDARAVTAGRDLVRADEGRPVVVLETKYAAANGLPAAGSMRLAGGAPVRWVGHAHHPDHLTVIAPGISFGGEEHHGIVMTSLTTAQRLAGRPGTVNEVVVRTADGADPAAVAARVRRALDAALPSAGAAVTLGADEESRRLLYRDAENDQRVYDVIALLVLLGAGLAAFNLAGRVVESQRREIGVGMALGIPAAQIAVRPVLLGIQTAVLGVVLGIPAGVATAAALRPALESLLPLPVLLTDLEPSAFARGVALGIAIPVVATAYPVWRGVRVPPVEAIRTGPRRTGGGPVRGLRGLRLPGRTLVRMGPRNAFRSPRRTAMTALGLAAVVAALVAIAGMLDSFDATMARSEAETAGGTPDRVLVDLDRLTPADASAVRRVLADPAVARGEPGLTVPGTAVAAGRDPVDLRVSTADPAARLWSPTVSAGRAPRGPGDILIAEAAADDLGVAPGDRIVLRHPAVTASGTTVLRETPLTVSGTHPNPFRFLAYVHPDAAGAFGAPGLVNTVSVLPAPGRTTDDVARALVGIPGVVSVQDAAAGPRVIRAALDEFGGVLRVAEGAALLLALLIAFNAAAITADERRREHATLLAFGVPTRAVVAVIVAESALIGVLGTVAGVLLGRAVLGWIVGNLFAETLPDVGTVVWLAPWSLVTAAVVGVAATALAPALTARGIRRIDLPSALRTVE